MKAIKSVVAKVRVIVDPHSLIRSHTDERGGKVEGSCFSSESICMGASGKNVERGGGVDRNNSQALWFSLLRALTFKFVAVKLIINFHLLIPLGPLSPVLDQYTHLL